MRTPSVMRQRACCLVIASCLAGITLVLFSVGHYAGSSMCAFAAGAFIGRAS